MYIFKIYMYIFKIYLFKIYIYIYFLYTIIDLIIQEFLLSLKRNFYK